MLTCINQFLDRTTMYKVVSYSLFVLIAQSFIFSLTGVTPYHLVSLIISLVVILCTAVVTHFVFAKVFHATANIESTYISAFIAFLVLAPISSREDALWTFCAVLIMIASKYLIAVNHRHIFNPVALGLFVIGIIGSASSSWWLGSVYFLPSLIVIALLLVTKLKRHVLFISYLVAGFVTIVTVAILKNVDVVASLEQHVLSWPLIFLGVFMLTEPLTTPPTKKLQGVYGVLVGVLSSFSFSFPPFYSTPEFALLVGNLAGYVVSTKSRIFLSLVEKKEIAKDTFEFIFSPSKKLSYEPGQYMEWTFAHQSPDIRGIRRYFTIASSPLEEVVRLGVKRAENGSSFKNNLFSLEIGKGMLATSVMGDFLLPGDPEKKLVFIAGGIGITPFVSMLRTLILQKTKRDVVLFYANKTEAEIAYNEVLDEATKEMGLSLVHVLSDAASLPANWSGETGFVTADMVKKYVTDFIDRKYYISGPPGMVASYKKMLGDMGVSSHNITTDFFPGFN